MKFNTQGLALVIVFQLIISGATLSITATNAGAVALPCAIPESDSELVGISTMTTLGDVYNPYSDESYLTTGEMFELDFRNECKNYARTPLVFRQEIKTTHEKCEGIGDVCWFKGSVGCGIEDGGNPTINLQCSCEIEFNYCTQTTPGIESEGKVERSLEKYK